MNETKEKTGTKKMDLRRAFGFGLLALSALLYLSVVLVAPLLPVTVAVKGGLAVGFAIAGEVAFLLGAVLVGKDVIIAIRDRILRRRKKSAQ